MEHLAIGSLETKADAQGVFSGYAATFGNIDRVNDVIEKGAFRKTVAKFKKEGSMPLLWQHRTMDVIGAITDMKEDDNGLLITGNLVMEVDEAKKAYALMKAGAIRKMSIGFMVDDYEVDRKKGTRIIKGIDLFEVSLVTFPANEQASVTNVKGLPHDSIRDFEDFLRDAGYSRKKAAAIACHGFKALNMEQCEAGDDGALNELKGSIERVLNIIGVSQNGHSGSKNPD